MYINWAENYQALDVVGTLAHAGTSRGFQVLDVTNPEQPQPRGHITMTHGVKALDAVGSTVYLVSTEGFTVGDEGGVLTLCDVRDPAAPRVVGQLGLPRPERTASPLWAEDHVLFIDGYVYVFTAKAGLAIADVRRPGAPRLVQPFDEHTLTNEVLRVDDRLYVARSDADLEVLDIRDPGHPQIIDRIRFPNRGQTRRLAVAGNRLYVTAISDILLQARPGLMAGLTSDRPAFLRLAPAEVPLTQATPTPSVPELEFRIIDVTDPLDPTVLGEVAVGELAPGLWRPDTIHVVGDRAVQLLKDVLVTVDVGDPTQPVVTSRLDLPGSPTRFELVPPLGLVGDGSDQLLLLDMASLDDPAILGTVGLPSAAADWGVVDGLVYLFSPPGGTLFEPRYSTLRLLRMDRQGGLATMAELPFWLTLSSAILYSAVLDDHIYFGNSSLHVFDVADPTAPREVYAEPGFFGLFGGRPLSAHDDILTARPINDNGCMLAAFDISDRARPRYIGLQYTSYATCSMDALAVGPYVYIANSHDGLTVNLPLLAGTPRPTPRSDPGEWPPPVPAATETPTPTPQPAPSPLFLPRVATG
jgi:hypothetical protein